MLVTAIPDPGLGNTAYLVDLGDGSALVVDPERDPRPYLDAAGRRGLVIRHVAETHLHADFVSGARELVALGAGLVAPRRGRLEHPHRPVEDGEEVPVGDLALRVVATPGHTPEHVAYVLADGSQPVAAFTGGTLMAGGIARPDLVSPELTVPLARDAYRSVRRLLDLLPGETGVYPTHGGGSFCASTAGSSPGASTVAGERRVHPAAVTDDESAFVEAVLADLGSYPAYFTRLREVNRRGPAVLGPDLPPLAPVEPSDLADTVVVDARPIDRFARGHIPGSISIELRDQFGTWLGWILDPGTPAVFVLDPDQDERELVRQTLTVGHEAIVGRTTIEGWTAAGGEVARIDLLPAGAIPPDGHLLDVRQRSEWAAGHVPGAIHVELGELIAGPGAAGPGTITHCGHGQRAMTAASLLARHGVGGVAATDAGPADIATALASS